MDLNYCVGKQVFADKFQAASQAWRTKQEVHFNLFDTVFDRTDWSQEPTLSWDQLLDMRAAQIASKNRPIVLHFSGGTDSYTIYRVFERNNIHLSALVFNYQGDLSDVPYSKTHAFLQQGIYDPHCEIIYHNYLDNNCLEELYSTPDWNWNTMERHQWAVYSGTGNGDEQLCAKFGQDVVSVLGTDKPRLSFDSQGIYSYQDDMVWMRHMKSSRLDSFFITPELPELHVKQSWMLKKYLQQKFSLNRNDKDFTLVNNHHNPVKFDWHEYSMASGRLGDLANSHIQHILARGTKLMVPKSGSISDAQYIGRMWKDWARLEGTSTRKNYVKGLMAAATDGAGQYLGMNTDNLLYVRSLYSKGHRMPW